MSTETSTANNSPVRLCIMGSEGDRVLTTDVACAEPGVEVLDLAGVEREFKALLGSGYAAFVTEQEGGTSQRTEQIVPGAFEHVLFRQGHGG